MDNHLNQWISIIEGMVNSNTYKIMWGKAIIDILEEDSNPTITFEQIAHKMISYYWDLEFFFGLKQAPQKEKSPVIVQIVQEIIERYKETSSSIPDWYIKVEKDIQTYPEFNRWLRKIVSIMKLDVCHRFMILDGKPLPIYLLDKESETITFDYKQIEVIQSNGFVLKQLLNYKLAQLLEQYNDSPRITQKVRGLSDQQLRRNNLTKYRKILLSLKPEEPIIDFYTGKVLEEHQISVDHVIPWSFIYSNDLWNLVITSKSFNSQKSNRTPDRSVIERLQKRNQQLLSSDIDEKLKQELEISVEQNYPLKFLNRMQ
jgi:5-methylcytosine-specific restriction endonuclease McrA